MKNSHKKQNFIIKTTNEQYIDAFKNIRFTLCSCLYLSSHVFDVGT